MSTTSSAHTWDKFYVSGRGIKPLSDAEIHVVRERLSLDGGVREPRALDVCCGTGELARLLAELGYAVDAVDYAQGAVDRASGVIDGATGGERGGEAADTTGDRTDAEAGGGNGSSTGGGSGTGSDTGGGTGGGAGSGPRGGTGSDTGGGTGRKIAYHCLDVSSGALGVLAPDGGFDVITVRRSLAHLADRTRAVAELAGLLRPEGTLCVITPHADRLPDDLRHICLDDAEIDLLTNGWHHAERVDVDDCTVVLLRGPAARAVSYREKGRPKAAALVGVAVVVTNAHGQVLLGWNPSRAVWELPAGRVEPGEAFEDTAVRELEEETGLRAVPGKVVLLGTLCDDSHGMTRVTEIARLTDYDGEPRPTKPDMISRWEWHTPADLRTLPQSLFTASAQALNTVWPGLLRHVPSAHLTPRTAPDGKGRLRFGEPPTAVRLREQLAEDLTEAGWTGAPRLRAAFEVVPRQAFLPEQPLRRAYVNEAIATVTADDGGSLSSVSQPEMQAVMLDRGRLPEGGHGLEIGGGGYNAALMAELVGPEGTVTCVEFDPYVHRRTVRFLEETGYADRVRVVLGDGAHGAPEHLVPPGGFDTILVTVAAIDVPPAWTAQLAEGGRLVVPLRLGGYTRCVAFEKRGPLLQSTHVSPCGFVSMQGSGRWDDTPVPIGESGYGIRWEDTPPAPVDGLEGPLAGVPVETWTGVTVDPDESYETLQLWLAVALPGFCRLTGDAGKGPVRLPKHQDAAAMVTVGSVGSADAVGSGDSAGPTASADSARSLACLTLRRIESDEKRACPVWEFGAQGFGPDAETLATTVAAAVHTWDRDIRCHAAPQLTVLPASMRDDPGATPHFIDKPNSRIAITFQEASS